MFKDTMNSMMGKKIKDHHQFTIRMDQWDKWIKASTSGDSMRPKIRQPSFLRSRCQNICKHSIWMSIWIQIMSDWISKTELLNCLFLRTFWLKNQKFKDQPLQEFCSLLCPKPIFQLLKLNKWELQEEWSREMPIRNWELLKKHN